MDNRKVRNLSCSYLKRLCRGEHWCTVKDNCDYEVSTFGRIRRRTKGPNTYPGNIIKCRDDGRGYFKVTLYKDGYQYNKKVHRLVAETFLGKIPTKHVANHKDHSIEKCAENLYKVIKSLVVN